MMFESSLLTQLCVENPLPTLVEVEISRSLNSAMRRAFLFFHLLAAEKLSFLATLVPYGDEMYLALQGGIEHFLLFNADTTFTELMFGLRRVQIAERALLLHAATPPASASAAAAQLREILLGPSPMPSAEERAVQYVAARDSGPFSGLPLLTSAADAVSHGIGAPAAAEAAAAAVASVDSDGGVFADASPLGGGGGGGVGGGGGGGGLPDLVIPGGGEGYSADELMTASRASYGYLRFSPMSRQQRIISLFLLTIKPYAEKKLKMWHANETDTAPDAVALREAYALRYPIRAQLKRVFYGVVFPVVHVLHKLSELVFKVAYLCELTPYTSPLHRLFRIIVKRSNPGEDGGLDPRTRRALTLARILIFVVFFGFQLLEFTRSAGFSGSTLLDDNDEAALPIPPPPVWGVDMKKKSKRRNRSSATAAAREDAEEGGGGGENDEDNEEEGAAAVDPGQCPVCRNLITNAAVITTSGVLGCYPCLQQHVRQHRCCPATDRPTTNEQIRRVFEC